VNTRRDFLKCGIAAAASSLAARASVPGKKVVVMGAGLAGLSAASELVAAGHDVTVLEARDRPGGRVFTLRAPFSGGVYAEAGALVFPGTHAITMKYVKQFDLELNSTSLPDLFGSYYARGRRLTPGKDPLSDWPFHLTAEETRMGIAGMQAKYLGAGIGALGNPTASPWPGAAQSKFDQQTFADYMRAQGASEEAIALLRLGYFDEIGDGVDHASALSALRELALGAGATYHKIHGGNDLLPRAMAKKLGDRIRYSSPVVEIKHGPANVQITYLENGLTQRITGDRLICALPFSVLKTIAASPRWSAGKQAAITELPYTSVSRVFMQTKRRFWLDRGVKGFTVTDLPCGLAGDATFDSRMPGGSGILESYMCGANSWRVAAMNENERIRYTVAQMEKPYTGLNENLVTATSKCWDHDERSRGAYAWFKPGQMTALMPHIARSEGVVHFAGEHTSPWAGWMQGALESGIRAAREVVEAPAPAEPITR